MLTIRCAEAADEGAWRRLWDAYLAFYAADVPADVSRLTWQRALDPDQPLWARVASRGDARLCGFAIAVLHPATWSTGPVCYLEDLFVDPPARCQGIGRALIDDLFRLGRERGCSQIYWHTHQDNAPARRLYDRHGPADGFVRYRFPLR